MKLTKQYLPSTDQYVGDSFFTNGPDGKSLATPLLLALVCVELSDVLFAVDSIPAVFGVTSDPFIAFTSNAFGARASLIVCLMVSSSTRMRRVNLLPRIVQCTHVRNERSCAALLGLRALYTIISNAADNFK